MGHCKFIVKLLSGAAFGILLGQPSAGAEGYQFGQDVRTFCSQYDLGQYHLWECDSSISYIDSANSQVFYCKGIHLVVTIAGKVNEVSLSAECTLTFDPHPETGSFTLLDMTKDRLPEISRSKGDLYPDGVAWVATRDLRDVQYCSRFTAGQAGVQSRCTAATFK
jgi:hypothetical protein